MLHAGTELARQHLTFQVQNPAAFENKNPFFIGVQMERSFARWNPSDELRHLFAAEVGMNQIAEHAVRAGANLLAVVFMHRQTRGFARRASIG